MKHKMEQVKKCLIKDEASFVNELRNAVPCFRTLAGRLGEADLKFSRVK